ncbi:hypothetical protein [Nostoc edaphicum]|uniref:hypothetical protein n=1 Tax=Nostoc edaphicum TaxID=264686 RepID=UPI001EEA7C53|nr:hypothetical protein [Nostoc edaphicum]
MLTQILENEEDLADYPEKILRGIAYKFGNNSYEYQMAGGTRKSARKRIVRQSKCGFCSRSTCFYWFAN